ncbi:MAG: hypothetical protein JJ899_12795, partial [Alphaproteobacteria bacterium]|nr:hypothetical protein [Alphaproteobacteria bacterium]
MEAFNFLGDVLSLANFGAMMIGIIVGLVIGAIPGLGIHAERVQGDLLSR